MPKKSTSESSAKDDRPDPPLLSSTAGSIKSLSTFNMELAVKTKVKRRLRRGTLEDPDVHQIAEKLGVSVEASPNLKWIVLKCYKDLCAGRMPDGFADETSKEQRVRPGRMQLIGKFRNIQTQEITTESPIVSHYSMAVSYVRLLATQKAQALFRGYLARRRLAKMREALLKEKVEEKESTPEREEQCKPESELHQEQGSEPAKEEAEPQKQEPEPEREPEPKPAEAEAEAEAEPEAEAEAEAEPEPEHRPEPDAEPEPEAKQESDPETVVEPEPDEEPEAEKVESDIATEPEPKPEAESRPESTTEHETVELVPPLNLELELEPEPLILAVADNKTKDETQQKATRQVIVPPIAIPLLPGAAETKHKPGRCPCCVDRREKVTGSSTISSQALFGRQNRTKMEAKKTGEKEDIFVCSVHHVLDPESQILVDTVRRSKDTFRSDTFRGSPRKNTFRGSPRKETFRGSPRKETFRGSPRKNPGTFRGSPRKETLRDSIAKEKVHIDDNSDDGVKSRQFTEVEFEEVELLGNVGVIPPPPPSAVSSSSLHNWYFLPPRVG